MTKAHEASRRLVKSPPELWAECSDAGSLARHLGEFGEIKITRVEPETTVAWEGEQVSGTVRIESSAWGTRVTLTVVTEAPDGAADEATGAADEVPAPDPVEESDATAQETLEEPDPPVAAQAPRFRSRWRRLTARMRAVVRGPEPALAPSSEPPAPSEEALAFEAEAAESLPEAPRGLEIPPEPGAVTGSPVGDLDPEAVTGSPVGDLDPEAVLVAALDSLGQAHHRPYSRA
jgi:hypothetical protein